MRQTLAEALILGGRYVMYMFCIKHYTYRYKDVDSLPWRLSWTALTFQTSQRIRIFPEKRSVSLLYVHYVILL